MDSIPSSLNSYSPRMTQASCCGNASTPEVPNPFPENVDNSCCRSFKAAILTILSPLIWIVKKIRDAVYCCFGWENPHTISDAIKTLQFNNQNDLSTVDILSSSIRDLDSSPIVDELRKEFTEKLNLNKHQLLALLDEHQKLILSRLKDSKDKGALAAYCAYMKRFDGLCDFGIVSTKDAAHQEIRSIGVKILYEKIDQKGFRNIGLSCWLGSTLQLLFADADRIDNGTPFLEKRVNWEDRTALRQINRVVKLLHRNIWREDEEYIRLILSDLRKLLLSLAKIKSERSMEDPSEVSRRIFQAFGLVYYETFTHTYIDDKTGKEKTETITHTYVDEDGKEKLGFKVSQHSLQIGMAPHTAISEVQQLIDANLTEEIDNPEESWRTNGLVVSKYTRRMDIDNKEDHLLVGFKRWELDHDRRWQKKSGELRFPQDGILKIGEDRYQVVAFICHLGSEMDTGHYVTCRLCSDGQWRKYSDEKVEVINDEYRTQMQSHNTYQMLLRKQTVS